MVKRRIISITLLNLKIVYELFNCKGGLTIKKLAENIKTDYKNTYNAVDLLFNDGIIQKEKVGNYNVCKLNYANRDTVNYINWSNLVIKVNDFKRKHDVEYTIITETIDTLKRVNPFFICVVFGSYAKNEEKKDSDIDILFLGHTNKPEFKNILNKINTPYQKKFHVVEQDIHDFIKDFKKKGKLSVATEIYKEPSIVFYGDDIFFKMLIEANDGNLE